MDDPRTLAIDIGGTGIKLALLDGAGRIIGKPVRQPTPTPPVAPQTLTAAIGAAAAPLGGFDRVSVGLYLAMGWLALIAIKPMFTHVPLPGILWIVAGGVAYTGGLGFFAAHRLRYSHFIWHLFVIAGTVCHFFAVLWYAA